MDISLILPNSSSFVHVLLISTQLRTDTNDPYIISHKYRNWYILSIRLLNYRFQHGQNWILPLIIFKPGLHFHRHCFLCHVWRLAFIWYKIKRLVASKQRISKKVFLIEGFVVLLGPLMILTFSQGQIFFFRAQLYIIRNETTMVV